MELSGMGEDEWNMQLLVDSTTDTKWVPISDRRGIWNTGKDDPPQRLPLSEERQEYHDVNHDLVVTPQTQEESMRDWPDDETSLIRNSKPQRDVAKGVKPALPPSPPLPPPPPPETLQLQRESSGTVWQGIYQEMEENAATPPPPSSSKRSQLQRESSGNVWVGIQEGPEGPTIAPVIKSYSSFLSSIDDSSLESDSDDDNGGLGNNESWESIIDPASIEKMVPQKPNRWDRKANKKKEQEGKATIWDSILEPQQMHFSGAKSEGGSTSGPIMDHLKHLTDMLSFDYVFGAIPTKQEYAESMVLRLNMNADLGLHAEETEDGIIIASLDEGCKLAVMGYVPGMRIIKINNEPCPKRITGMHAFMQIKIEAVTENGTVKSIAFDAHEMNLDLHVHKVNPDSMHTYISQVPEGSRLSYAGFQAGMRITKINDQPCPSTFLDMVKLMTVKVTAIPVEKGGSLSKNEENAVPVQDSINLPCPPSALKQEEDEEEAEEQKQDGDVRSCPELLKQPLAPPPQDNRSDVSVSSRGHRLLNYLQKRKKKSKH